MTARIRLRSWSLAIVVALAGSLVSVIAGAPAARAERPGNVNEYPIPGGGFVGSGALTTGPDGNLWWADGSHINRMALTGPPVSQFAASANSITAGPDGNLWFTATGPNVGRITPAGVITLFPAPANASRGLQSITAGADGNLWVLYQGADSTIGDPIIAKVTTAGAATPYVLNRESLATQITTGGDGRIWWIDRNNATIDVVDPANPVGTFTAYSDAGHGLGIDGGFQSLTAGSDGNIWYSKESCCSFMGQITPTGASTVYPVTVDSGPNAVTLGPDGNVWFNGAQAGEATLHRISPDGTIKSFDLGHDASSGRPLAMTAGPDGAIWYMFNNNNTTIGRLAVGAVQTAVTNLASGFSNNNIVTPGPGTNVKFVFDGPGTTATATDTTGPGLGLFDSGSHLPVTSFSYNYVAAGTYTYSDAVQPSHTGTVGVPPRLSTNYTYAGAAGGGAYTVTWASAPPPAGFVYDVQRQDPGGGVGDFAVGTTATGAPDRPFSPAGSYAYRARLRRTSDNVASGWSPEARIRYGSGVPAAFSGYPTQRSVFRPDSGSWFIDDGGPSTFSFGLPGDMPVPMDFDGDGAVNRAVYRPDVGAWYYDDGGPSTFFFGLPGDIPVPGDYNGDGIADRAVFRPSIGAWFIDDGGPTTVFFGLSGDVPVPGDYDNDGKIDEAVYRPSTGQWFVLRSSDSAVEVTNFGLSSDIPVPGDYDGDGKTDVAVFRPSSGTWFIHNSSGAPDTALNYGLSVDIPVPGDYNADGITDIAVYRRTSGAQWYIHPSGGGPDTVSNFGFASDIPLPLPAAIENTYFP